MKRKSISEFVMVGAMLCVSSCYYYEDIPRIGIQPHCAGSDLTLSATAQNATGCGTTDGSIIASSSGGKTPYNFSLNGGPPQSSGTFSNLKGGFYLVTVVDASLCQGNMEVVVANSGSNFNAAIKAIDPDTDCFGSNGAVELSATGGKTPYQYSLGADFGTSAIFSNLAAGTYNATVRDADQCEVNIGVEIPNGVSTSYTLDIMPIFTAKCNFTGCHGTGTGRRDYTKFDNVKADAAEIKIRTANGTMPKNPKPGGSLSTDQINRIACWVDEGANNN